MPVVPPLCCGIDGHPAQLMACLRRVDADGQVTPEVREFATTDEALRTLSTWRTEEQCPVAALECGALGAWPHPSECDPAAPHWGATGSDAHAGDRDPEPRPGETPGHQRA
jgi:hypothetical protein